MLIKVCGHEILVNFRLFAILLIKLDSDFVEFLLSCQKFRVFEATSSGEKMKLCKQKRSNLFFVYKQSKTVLFTSKMYTS